MLVYCGQAVGWIKIPFGMVIGLGSGHTVLDADPAPPKGAQHPPIFGTCLLWPNGWMDLMRLGTEIGLGPGNIVLNSDPAAPSRKGHSSPNFRPIYYGQTAGLIMMKLGAEVDLGSGQIVLDGDQLPPPKGRSTPQFSAHVYCGQTAGWI